MIINGELDRQRLTSVGSRVVLWVAGGKPRSTEQNGWEQLPIEHNRLISATEPSHGQEADEVFDDAKQAAPPYDILPSQDEHALHEEDAG